jgi:hypothetical protein
LLRHRLESSVPKGIRPRHRKELRTPTRPYSALSFRAIGGANFNDVRTQEDVMGV